jgi:PEP-CTERM/exosortase A-associated glycosyltransferase
MIWRARAIRRDAAKVGRTLTEIHNRSLKILHIVEHGIALSSGYGFRSVNIFRAQRERGWQPAVLTFPKPNESDKGCWKQPETVEGLTCYYRPLRLSASRLLPRFLEKRRRRSGLVKRIHEVVEVERPNLLHAHSPVCNGVAALKVGRKLGIPVVYEIRSLWEEAAVAHGTYEYHSHRFKRRRSLENWVCENVDHVVAISNGLKQHLIGRGIAPNKISIVSNGVDLDTMKPGEPESEYKEIWKLTGKKIVGYIGSFRRYEGLDLLIKAVDRLSKTRGDIVLLLIGGGRDEVNSELSVLIEKLGLHEKVIMPGWLPAERIPSAYALIDVLVYPRKRIPLTDIITPLKPLEAMAMGKALIASDIGGHRELIRPDYNGVLFPAGDESALADAVSRLLDNQSLSLTLARQAAAWVREECSWRKTTAVYSEIYDNARRVHSSRHALGDRFAARLGPTV